MVIDTDTLLLIIIIGVAIAIVLGLHTEWRFNRLLRGKSGKNLEEIIIKNTADIDKFKQFRKEMETYLVTVEKRLHQSIRGVATVRINPFKGTGDGGQQSFATAFLDDRGNGVVFSTLHTRERMSIFAKPIRGGKSEYELTEEERHAIQKADPSLHL